jgi:hypothetical protein
MKRYLIVTCAFVSAVSSSCGSAGSNTTSAPSTVETGSGAEPQPSQVSIDVSHWQAVDCLRSTTQIETYRTHGQLTANELARRADPRFEHTFIGDWPIIASGATFDISYARRLVDFLLDERNFVGTTHAGQGTACTFDPEVILRLRGDADIADVVICMKCSQMTVHTSRGRLRRSTLDYSPGRAKLAPLVKRVFPKDRTIQAL